MKYDFNLTIALDIDKAFTNRTLAERWSAAFQDQPELSSSLISRARKKDKTKHRFTITDIPASFVKLPNQPTHLTPEFALKGVAGRSRQEGHIDQATEQWRGLPSVVAPWDGLAAISTAAGPR